MGRGLQGGCKNLDKACSVYGNQGLELDCPIVIFWGGYIRSGGNWIARGSRYDYDVRENNYNDPDSIVENNFRVLLTRTRKEMILLISEDPILDETHKYFKTWVWTFCKKEHAYGKLGQFRKNITKESS